ncbi:MAG TPA: hypothetical protein VI306_11970 [Pyrinomonadaceae bacterium]
MRRRISPVQIVLVIGLVLASVSVFLARQRTQQSNDFKVRYKTTTGTADGPGMSGETITMIKGARERSETKMGYGFDTINITQCDLKRTIQISDNAKKYFITPMETGEPNAPTTPATRPAPNTPSTRGGVVDYFTSIVDTGERKEMFGFTARHVKTTTEINAPAGSCNPSHRKIELDGWYIDLNVEFNCQTERTATMPTGRQPTGGCRDRINIRRQGTGKTGYPLIETMKMYGEDGEVSITQTKEVVELSRATLDPSLFDVPAGYAQAASSSELYGTPSMSAMMGQMGQSQAGQSRPSSSSMQGANTTPTKRPGSLLVGVVQFNNKAGRSVSLDSLRERLIGQLSSAGVDAVALNASSQMEAEAEAKVKQCDFILYTDVATLKVNKLGGMLGGLAGGGVPGMPKTEAKLEFKLFAVGEASPRLQSNASAKEEGEENSAGTAVDAEARAVSSEVKKRRN